MSIKSSLSEWSGVDSGLLNFGGRSSSVLSVVRRVETFDGEAFEWLDDEEVEILRRRLDFEGLKF